MVFPESIFSSFSLRRFFTYPLSRLPPNATSMKEKKQKIDSFAPVVQLLQSSGKTLKRLRTPLKKGEDVKTHVFLGAYGCPSSGEWAIMKTEEAEEY